MRRVRNLYQHSHHSPGRQGRKGPGENRFHLRGNEFGPPFRGHGTESPDHDAEAAKIGESAITEFWSHSPGLMAIFNSYEGTGPIHRIFDALLNVPQHKRHLGEHEDRFGLGFIEI